MDNIITITTPFVLNITVNCYLVRSNDGFILIDTGKSGKQELVEQALYNAGCQPQDLKLIVLTHGDFDHCGNAVYLRDRFGAKIAMHRDDLGMVEQGDMFWNRQQPNPIVKKLMRVVINLPESSQFTPDICIEEGDNLQSYGFDARVIELPGHSQGSIGLLTADGRLFCGDLLGNTKQPDLWTIMDDHQAADMSVAKLHTYPIDMVYPGHGKPFAIQAFWDAYQT